MSYDVWLEIDTGAEEPTTVGREFNYTSNCAPMWCKAGADIADLNFMWAQDAAEILRTAIDTMTANPDEYRALNPDNGWGDYEGCLTFLRELADECEKHNKATVRVTC